MKEQDNIKLVRQGYDAFLKGDLNGLLSMFSSDIDWEIPEVEAMPFSGKRHGIDAVAGFFRDMLAAQDVREMVPDEFIGQGDTVVVLGHFAFTVKSTGREYSDDFCHVFRIANGQISGFKEYADTHKAAMAYEPQMAGTSADMGQAGGRSIH
ncbi:hypothetical protein GCM10027321_08030 [Massilia terrae]|uniref:Nuclear transport factor 2 family protein n=1 Tax=Massilia terrae TaxID=1811224 RepID=A0ABT2D071_9BURK|nr:nuclear transport factor 2 family protein [Massilia terrae]MCS0659624.1 nuclear transport factor 2 family protein [Massilia terrae]